MQRVGVAADGWAVELVGVGPFYWKGRLPAGTTGGVRGAGAGRVGVCALANKHKGFLTKSPCAPQ